MRLFSLLFFLNLSLSLSLAQTSQTRRVQAALWPEAAFADRYVGSASGISMGTLVLVKSLASGRSVVIEIVKTDAPDNFMLLSSLAWQRLAGEQSSMAVEISYRSTSAEDSSFVVDYTPSFAEEDKSQARRNQRVFPATGNPGQQLYKERGYARYINTLGNYGANSVHYSAYVRGYLQISDLWGDQEVVTSVAGDEPLLFNQWNAIVGVSRDVPNQFNYDPNNLSPVEIAYWANQNFDYFENSSYPKYQTKAQAWDEAITYAADLVALSTKAEIGQFVRVRNADQSRSARLLVLGSPTKSNVDLQMAPSTAAFLGVENVDESFAIEVIPEVVSSLDWKGLFQGIANVEEQTLAGIQDDLSDTYQSFQTINPLSNSNPFPNSTTNFSPYYQAVHKNLPVGTLVLVKRINESANTNSLGNHTNDPFDQLLSTPNSYTSNTTYNSSNSSNENNTVVEKGFAEEISIQSNRPLVALHPTAQIGTLMIVSNKQNGRNVTVEVAGKPSRDQLGAGAVIGLSKYAYARLGSDLKKTEVEITYRNLTYQRPLASEIFVKIVGKLPASQPNKDANIGLSRVAFEAMSRETKPFPVKLLYFYPED